MIARHSHKGNHGNKQINIHVHVDNAACQHLPEKAHGNAEHLLRQLQAPLLSDHAAEGSPHQSKANQALKSAGD